MQGRKFLFISLLCLGLLIAGLVELPAQEQESTMRVAQTDVEGRAIRFDFNFTSQELKGLFEWLSRETDLTIIASEEDIQDKKFSLINLRNVTIEEVIEKIKTVLTQYDLTLIQTDNTLLITTFERAMVTKGTVKNITPDPELVDMTDEIQTYIIQLNTVVASEQVERLKPLLNKQANIFADTATNTLVITDVASNIRRIVAILQVADEGERFPLKILIIPLGYADASTLAQTLSSIFQERDDDDNERQQTGSGPGMSAEDAKTAAAEMKADGTGYEVLDGTIKIVAETSSNSLVLKASEANLVFLQEIVRELDVAPSLQTHIRTFRLKYAAAEDVATTLQEVLTGERSENRGRMDPWDRAKLRDYQRERGVDQSQGIIGNVNVSHNDRLNIVVVSSDPRNFSIIEKVINELDQEQTQEEIRLYFLKFADAETLVPSLQDLFEGGTTGADRERPWWERRFREPTEEGGGGGGFGVQGEVHLVADIRLNAVLISTSAQNFETIDGLIKKLDVNMPDQEWGTRMYKLKFADAENVAAIINNVYQGSGGNTGNFFFFLAERQRNQTQGSLAGNVTAEAYPTLNAVIVSTATQRNFDLITEFINSMDVPTPEGQREITEAIRLEYGNADHLQQVLDQVWEGDESDGFDFRAFFASGGRQEQQDINSLRGKVTIFADADTNSLIVTTRQRYLPAVRALIKKLDFVRGQVWIDIQILEVTLDETTKLGIELTAQEKRIFGTSIAPGNPLIGNFESQLGLEQEISGFNIGLATREYLSLLHTLMRENKVQTLSTPSLLTRDSWNATWSSGRRIPYLQSVDTTSILGEAVSQPLFNYDFIDPPVGINISLTPYIAKSQVSEDGKRTIGLDIENISASNFIEFTDFNAPITDDNAISVYIDVEDGQQIVVGGIIRKKQKQVENKLPILGDIPLIGRLFKNTETGVEDTEIVIIITPHIVDINNPDDLEKLKEKAQDWQNNGATEKEKESGEE